MNKFSVFIDGEFLFFTFKSMVIQEKDIDWHAFHGLIKNKIENYTNVSPMVGRIHIFKAESVAFFPVKRNEWFNNKLKNDIKEYKVYDADNRLITDYASLTEDDIEKIRLRAVTDLKDFKEKYMSGVLGRYRHITINNAFIELSLTGFVKYDPIIGRPIEEKGVDVGIATDMILKSDNYDVAIILSGDADLTPAIKQIKNKMKFVFLLRVFKEKPPRPVGISDQLSQLVDGYIDFPLCEIPFSFRISCDTCANTINVDNYFLNDINFLSKKDVRLTHTCKCGQILDFNRTVFEN